MAKQAVRISNESLVALDEWAARRNISRTTMLELVLWAERQRVDMGMMPAATMSDFVEQFNRLLPKTKTVTLLKGKPE